MLQCEERGCTKPATGLFEVFPKRGGKPHCEALCAACGFNVHERKRFCRFTDKLTGREVATTMYTVDHARRLPAASFRVWESLANQGRV